MLHLVTETGSVNLRAGGGGVGGSGTILDHRSDVFGQIGLSIRYADTPTRVCPHGCVTLLSNPPSDCLQDDELLGDAGSS